MKHITIILAFLMTLSTPLRAENLEAAYADYTAQNYGSAFKKFQILADQNQLEAQALLGLMYLNGLGTAKNGREAVKWFKKSVARDYWFAHLSLGTLYHHGNFVPQSRAKAGFHYKRCADILGVNDKNGVCHEKTAFALQMAWFGNKQDAEAQKYYQKAFQLGGGGFELMAVLTGMAGDKTKNLMWWNICAAYFPSCKSGKEDAFAKALQLDIVRAQKMSNECVDSNFENCGWTY